VDESIDWATGLKDSLIFQRARITKGSWTLCKIRLWRKKKTCYQLSTKNAAWLNVNVGSDRQGKITVSCTFTFILLSISFSIFQNVALVAFGSNVYLILGKHSELKQLHGVSLIDRHWGLLCPCLNRSPQHTSDQELIHSVYCHNNS
jgi:hypothetical protein